MLPGRRDFYRCCRARRSASHVNKEFRQQFQNYAPPFLRGYKNKICTYHLLASELSERDSLRNVQLRIVDILLASERSERDTLRSVQSRIVYILLASERSDRDTLRSVQLRIADIIYYWRASEASETLSGLFN